MQSRTDGRFMDGWMDVRAHVRTHVRAHARGRRCMQVPVPCKWMSECARECACRKACGLARAVVGGVCRAVRVAVQVCVRVRVRESVQACACRARTGPDPAWCQETPSWDRRCGRAQEEARAIQACAIPKRPASGLPAAARMLHLCCKDGGDPCSVRGTQSHAMLATRALCRLEGVRHRNFRTKLTKRSQILEVFAK